jgi:hypothetical protein
MTIDNRPTVVEHRQWIAIYENQELVTDSCLAVHELGSAVRVSVRIGFKCLGSVFINSETSICNPGFSIAVAVHM